MTRRHTLAAAIIALALTVGLVGCAPFGGTNATPFGSTNAVRVHS